MVAGKRFNISQKIEGIFIFHKIQITLMIISFSYTDLPRFRNGLRVLHVGLLAVSLGLASCGKKTETELGAEQGEDAHAETAAPSEHVIKIAAEDRSPLPDTVTFNAHIQPVISEKCYHCHGPDSSTRMPKKEPLRIDRGEFAFEPRENGKPVIIKGNPAESYLVKVINTDDPEIKMPPPEAHHELTERDIALIEKWIEQGAEYQEHWAFIAPQKPAEPETSDPDWASNPIDHFTLETMDEHGLKPNSEQAPHRLLRRIYFDLTGLPPSQDEVEAFVAAHAEDSLKAINRVLDKLFKSPAYGEEQGRLWLDAARYGDTHGIHIDNYRDIWPYRDWVVQAFNQNMPFDQFTIEQLGGDLLPKPSLEQKVATGFNRCLPTTGEGGSIADEVDAMYATERVSTTFGVWQGLTVACAECHDHKFDPVSQKEFYQISAFFRNTTMHALDRNNGKHPPSIFVARPADRPRYNSLNGEVATLQKAVQAGNTKRNREREAEYQSWLARLKNPTAPGDELPTPGVEVQLPLINPTNNIITGTAKGQPISLNAEVRTLPGIFGHALQIGNRPPVEVGDYGNFDGKNGFSYGGFIYVDGKPNGAIMARMDANDNYQGWDLWIENGQIGAHVIERWPDIAVKAVTKMPLKPKQWHHVMVVYDPSKRKDSLTVYLDGKSSPLTYVRNNPGKDIRTLVPISLGSRAGNDARLRGVVAAQDLQVISKPFKPREVQDLAFKTMRRGLQQAPMNKTLQAALRQQFDIQQPAKPTPELQTIAQLNKEKQAIEGRGSYSLIMEEKPKGKPFAHILDRGDYASKLEKVFPGVPAVLVGKEAMPTKDRLDLAKWLVRPENPLTARVTINRQWHYLFGRGIVETTEDFGIMGARPSHPDLLDWLAVEFVESGWDLQHMLRLIMTSSTYRQSAVVSKDKLHTDPDNIYFSRAPRFRMHGEQLRDMVLASSGLLVKEVGGPPVRPYQPQGVWQAVAMPSSNTKLYKPDTGRNLYRRSIYTIWKRTAPPPSMELLNAPQRETFCVRRELTNTPLAAFVTMNDVQFVEAARIIAQKALKAETDTSKRLDYITLRLMARELDTGEKELATDTLNQILEQFNEQPEEAAKLIEVGEKPTESSLPAPELAAWTVIASQVLNLDETLTK